METKADIHARAHNGRGEANGEAETLRDGENVRENNGLVTVRNEKSKGKLDIGFSKTGPFHLSKEKVSLQCARKRRRG